MKKFVVIGHVDTGKSSLCGHLLYKCGFINNHEIDKFKDKKGKIIWSKILDIYEEERSKNKTHEFSSIEFKFNNEEYQLIDTPGHQCFVRSMIEGISSCSSPFSSLREEKGGVNLALVLISMIDNEFESSFERGMLKEHLILARSVGINNLIIVGNKMDAINWDKNKYEEKIKKVQKFVKKLRWNSIQHIPVSAYYGTGLVDSKDMPKWYNNNLLELINTIPNKEIQVIEDIKQTNEILVNTMILNSLENIITIGFSFILHYDGYEVDAIINKINGKLFLRSNETCICIIETEKPINSYNNMRVVLRKNNSTIGFGKVIQK